MLFSSTVARGAVAGAMGSGAVAAAMLFGAPSALGQPAPPPNCTAADLAGVSGSVAIATSAYLFTHPDVNDFLTSVAGERTDERRAAVVDYFNANPQVHAELHKIHEPLFEIQQRCQFTGNQSASDW